MKYFLDPFLGFIATLFGFIIHPVSAAAFGYAAYHYDQLYYLAGCAPFLFGLLAVAFSRWDTEKDAQGNDRGDLPGWASAWSTPDERLPGDVVGEPTVRWVYQHLGKYASSAYWLLERNRGMGFAFSLGRPTVAYLNGDLWGYQETADGTWRKLFKLGFCYIGAGNQTTVKPGAGLYAIPWLTLKRVRGDKP